MYRYPSEQLMTVEEAERLSELHTGRTRRKQQPRQPPQYQDTSEIDVLPNHRCNRLASEDNLGFGGPRRKRMKTKVGTKKKKKDAYSSRTVITFRALSTVAGHMAYTATSITIQQRE